MSGPHPQPSQAASISVRLALLVAALLRHGSAGTLTQATAQQHMRASVDSSMMAPLVGVGVAAGVLQRGGQQLQQQQGGG